MFIDQLHEDRNSINAKIPMATHHMAIPLGDLSICYSSSIENWPSNIKEIAKILFWKETRKLIT